MDNADGNQIVSILALSIFFGAFVLAILVIFNRKSDKSDETKSSNENSEKEKKDKLKSNPANEIKNNVVKQKPKVTKDPAFTHPLLSTTLKGHTGVITQTEFSRCGKYLGSCSEDRTIRLWTAKSFNEKDHKYIRVNVELDHASSISFSPDSRAFIASLSVGNRIRVFKITKRKDSSSSSFAAADAEDFQKVHKSDIINVGISSTGKFIMSASKDTTMIVWSLKGDVLATIDTLLIYNSCAMVSPCGTLIACSGFASDIKLWSVELDKKSGNFKQVVRALELKGHSAAVPSFFFSSDSKRVASISKDGTWKLWDIDVNYQQGQEAYLLYSGAYNDYFPNGISSDHVLITLSPDSFTVAIANGKSFIMVDAQTQEKSDVFQDVHGDNINCFSWSPDSRKLTTCGLSDRTIRVWQNPIGAKAVLTDLRQKLNKVKLESHKERIEQQIQEAKQYLKSISFS